MIGRRVGRRLPQLILRSGGKSKACSSRSLCGAAAVNALNQCHGQLRTSVIPVCRSRLLSTTANHEETINELEGFDLSDPTCNVTSNIASRVGVNLHLRKNHPLNTIKGIIEEYYKSKADFATFDDLPPIVSTQHNFDSLLIPEDHVSRSLSDTYYLDNDTVLRCHTSAHQTTLLQQGYNQFLVTGDVYRRDEIDSSHYPVFHQMEYELFQDFQLRKVRFLRVIKSSHVVGSFFCMYPRGVKMFTDEELDEAGVVSDADRTALVEKDLKDGLEGMARALFGDVEMRWVEAYFPFTDPSFELEIYFADEWLEVLGCGVVHKDIVRSSGRGTQPGWAFGLGLERLAMVLFSIPDIRLFWSTDERFHKQFESGKIVTFQPYSKYPPCFKDISFWTPDDSFHANDLNELVRDVAGDLVEKVELIDTFVHPKTNRLSNCFRISYRSMDRSLTNEEIDALQEQVRTVAVQSLGVELR